MTRTFMSALLVATALSGCNHDGSVHSETPASGTTHEATTASTPTETQSSVAEQDARRQRTARR